MRKLFISLLLAMSLAAPANAGITPAVDLEAALNGKYVWRGVVVVDDWVVQPSLSAGWAAFPSTCGPATCSPARTTAKTSSAR